MRTLILFICIVLCSSELLNREECFATENECTVYDTIGPKLLHTYKNKHLLFIGDSLTRYQYLDLVFTLHYGYPQNRSSPYQPITLKPETSMNVFNDFFKMSHDLIGPNEVADSCMCAMKTVAPKYYFDYWFDNRFYYDPVRNIRVSFITFFTGARGRLLPKDITDPVKTKKFETIPLLEREALWWHSDVAVLMYYVQEMEHRPDVLVLNFGHWHNRITREQAAEIASAAHRVTDHFVWKTTTYGSQGGGDEREILDRHDSYFAAPELNTTIMNTSWTARLHKSYWPHDILHFRNPVYTALNDQLADLVRGFNG